jgi:TRAP-type C4-dicarboxylate transport system substrate-binding protein
MEEEKVMKPKTFLRLFSFGIILVLVMTVVAACAKEAEPSKPITLVMSTHEPNKGIMYDRFWKPWIDEIEKRTGGKVKIEAHYNGELAGPPDAWDVLINKTVDISYVHLNNIPDKFPMCEIVAFCSYSLVNQQLGTVLLDLYNKYPEMQQELEEVHLMLLGSTYWTSWAGPKPIHTLEDMAGMKVLR